MSAAALLQKPYNEFFKAAVASAGNHDNNIYNDNWSERYHGLKEVPVGESGKDATAQPARADRRKGFGGGKGGGRKKGPPDWKRRSRPSSVDLIEMLDPEDQQSVEEVERQLAALQAKLAELKKADVGGRDREGPAAADRRDSRGRRRADPAD